MLRPGSAQICSGVTLSMSVRMEEKVLKVADIDTMCRHVTTLAGFHSQLIKQPVHQMPRRFRLHARMFCL